MNFGNLHPLASACIRLHPLQLTSIYHQHVLSTGWTPRKPVLFFWTVKHTPKKMQLSTVIGSLNLTLDRLYRLEPNYSSLLAVINSPVLLNPLCLHRSFKMMHTLILGESSPCDITLPPHGSCVLTSQNSCWAHQKLRTPIWSYYCLPPPNMDKEW